MGKYSEFIYRINSTDSIRWNICRILLTTDRWNIKWYSSLQEGLRHAPEKYRAGKRVNILYKKVIL
jgi:hypothetical protein